MIEVEERNDVMPLCPHCNNSITQLFFREINTFLGKRFLYFCSQCHKVLGISHRKGFWMG